MDLYKISELLSSRRLVYRAMNPNVPPHNFVALFLPIRVIVKLKSVHFNRISLLGVMYVCVCARVCERDREESLLPCTIENVIVAYLLE